MPTSFIFNNKNIQEPGSYSAITSAVKIQPSALASGNVLLIDTGKGAGWAAAGANGANLNGKSAVYDFYDSKSLKEFLRGGEWYDIADKLFKPNPSSSIPGAAKVSFISARESTPSTITIDLTASTNGGTIVLDTVEGVGSVGLENPASTLNTGFAVTMHAGVYDTAKFIFKFWVGAYRGQAPDGVTWDGSSGTPDPILIAQTDEISNISEIKAFVEGNLSAMKWFSVKTYTPVLTGAIHATDLVALGGSNILAVGGTEAYGATDFDAALLAVQDLDYTFVMTDKINGDAAGTENLKLLSHLQTEARFTKFMIVGGSDNSTNMVTQSMTPAGTFDSFQAIVVHGGIKKNLSFLQSGVRSLSSLHKAALVVGRMAGMEPQNPLTFKILNYDGEVHDMNANERKAASDAGVLVTKYDDDLLGHIVLYAVNTIQDNSLLLNGDGVSYSIQAMRIPAQLNKEIEILSKQDLLGDQVNGATKASLNDADVRNWTASYLTRQQTSDTDPFSGMIVNFSDISVSRDQDAIFISYGVEINTEITKLFFEGLITKV